MATVKLEKIPALTGQKGAEFIRKAEKPAPVKVSKTEIDIYNHLKKQALNNK